MWTVRRAGGAADQGSSFPGRHAPRIAGVGGERIRGQLAGFAAHPVAHARPRRRAFGLAVAALRDPVRDVLQQIEPRDPLRAQQRHRVGIRLLEERRQQIAGIDLGLLGVLAVRDRVLEHAVEGQRLARIHRLVARHALEIVGKKLLERALERGQVRPGVQQDLLAALVVRERVEQMLDRQVRVPARDGLAQGGLEREVQLASDLAHSFSTPARSG
jgi:hypothetical protein